MTEAQVELRSCRLSDFSWLAKTGLRREFMGVQYSWFELPLQLLVAPLRALLGPFVPACVVLVEGRRAGYVGRSPLSGNIEYFVCSWAQGRGVGRRAIRGFLEHHRAGDRPRRLFIRKHNDRSLKTLQGVLDELDWVEGVDYKLEKRRFATVFEIGRG